MITFKDEIASLPYVRVIFTKQANPSLASQAPNDKINSGVKLSVCDCIDKTIIDKINSPNVIASKFSKHRRKFLRVRAKAIEGMIIISGSII